MKTEYYDPRKPVESNDDNPVRQAARWLDAAEAEINSGDVVDSEFWQGVLDRVEAAAKITPSIMLELARLQLVEETAPPDEADISFGHIVQLGLMNRMLDEKAAAVAAACSSAVLNAGQLVQLEA